MEDIRFLGVEGENLLLETESGDQFRLVVDDALRRLIRKESSQIEVSEEISPREIQIQIRAGATVQELVERTGASADYIEKFAATVLDELQHVIASALAVRIQVPGDRFNEPIQSEFGEVISERLGRNRASHITWASKRDESGTWMVQCNFKTPAGDQEAIWSFDLKKLVLSPENETAYQLQTQAPLSAKSAPKPPDMSAANSDPLAPTGSIAVTKKPEAPKPFVEPKLVPVHEPKTPEVSEETTSIDVTNLATTTDLTDILRKRAAEAQANEPQTQVDKEAPLKVEEPKADTKPVNKPKTGKTPVVDLDATQPIEANPKKGRVPVQSWEEILLSTRSEDDQAN